MAVLLRRSDDLPSEGWDGWVAIGGARPTLDPARRIAGLADALEQAFDEAAPEWLALAKELGQDPSAVRSHTASAAPNASDFGLMMAWTRLVLRWSGAKWRALVVCDDPWAFRHFAAQPNVTAGKAPPLWPARIRLGLRGGAARLRIALVAARAARALKPPRPEGGGAWLLAYGHPASTKEGYDAYFGNLMEQAPDVRRILHVDAGPTRVGELAAPRTLSLHGFGDPWWALFHLPFARWRPVRPSGTWAALIRRAATLDGGTAQGAAIAWQIHCQRRFLAQVRPEIVAWPWENHGWERDLVRAARAAGTKTLGYQHSVIGRQMLNYGPGSNADGQASLPDHVLCSGAATRDQLLAWGIPGDRLAIGGAWRFAAATKVAHDPAAPVFLALPFDQDVAAEMVAAARNLGREVLVKDHPMTPFAFTDGDGVTRTNDGLTSQKAVSAVVFAATTVGLEAVLMGLPTLRFRPQGRVALDILPAGLAVPTTSAATLKTDLTGLSPPPALAREGVFAPVDRDLWIGLLSPQGDDS